MVKKIVNYLLFISSLMINPIYSQDVKKENIDKNSLEYKLSKLDSLNEKRNLIITEMKKQSIKDDSFQSLVFYLHNVYLEAAVGEEKKCDFEKAVSFYEKTQNLIKNYEQKSQKDFDDKLESRVNKMALNCRDKLKELSEHKDDGEYMGKQNLLMGNYDLAKKQLSNTKYSELPDFLRKIDNLDKDYKKSLDEKIKLCDSLYKILSKDKLTSSDEKEAVKKINQISEKVQIRNMLNKYLSDKKNLIKLPDNFQEKIKFELYPVLSIENFRFDNLNSKSFLESTNNYFEMVKDEKNVFLRDRASRYMWCFKNIALNHSSEISFKYVIAFNKNKKQLFNEKEDLIYIDYLENIK
ncbi:hypothetical protein KY334_04435 [Candidatus Woesearchaeota archaeon]|nr:hypothetical protein [Candidatus Woesearchaeota archaeon]